METLKTLKKFYDSTYKYLNFKKISASNLSFIIGDIETVCITSIENNIKFNFEKYVRRLVKSTFIKEHTEKLEQIKKDHFLQKNKKQEESLALQTQGSPVETQKNGPIIVPKEDVTKKIISSKIKKNLELTDEKNVDLKIKKKVSFKTKDVDSKTKKVSKSTNKNIDSKTKKETKKKSSSLKEKIANETKNFRSKMNILCKDLLENTSECDGQYKKWLSDNRTKIMPVFTKLSFLNDIKIKPQKYLKHMIYINKELERLGVKQFQFLPLKKATTQYIPLSNAALIDLFIDDKKLLHNMADNKYKIWSKVFNLKHKIFGFKKKD